MTTDSETTEQYLTFVWSRFLISVLVFVSRDFELRRVSVQYANAFAITIPFTRWRRHSVAVAFWGVDRQPRTGLIFSSLYFYHIGEIEVRNISLYCHCVCSGNAVLWFIAFCFVQSLDLQMKMITDKMQDKKQKPKSADSDESFQGNQLSLLLLWIFLSPTFMSFFW